MTRTLGAPITLVVVAAAFCPSPAARADQQPALPPVTEGPHLALGVTGGGGLIVAGNENARTGGELGLAFQTGLRAPITSEWVFGADFVGGSEASLNRDRAVAAGSISDQLALKYDRHVYIGGRIFWWWASGEKAALGPFFEMDFLGGSALLTTKSSTLNCYSTAVTCPTTTPAPDDERVASIGARGGGGMALRVQLTEQVPILAGLGILCGFQAVLGTHDWRGKSDVATCATGGFVSLLVFDAFR